MYMYIAPGHRRRIDGTSTTTDRSDVRDTGMGRRRQRQRVRRSVGASACRGRFGDGDDCSVHSQLCRKNFIRQSTAKDPHIDVRKSAYLVGIMSQRIQSRLGRSALSTRSRSDTSKTPEELRQTAHRCRRKKLTDGTPHKSIAESLAMPHAGECYTAGRPPRPSLARRWRLAPAPSAIASSAHVMWEHMRVLAGLAWPPHARSLHCFHNSNTDSD